MPKYKVINEDQGHQHAHFVTAPDRKQAMAMVSGRTYGTVVDAWEIDKNGNRVKNKIPTNHPLTKREYMATHILAGMFGKYIGITLTEPKMEILAKKAVQQTNYLLTQLKK